MNTAFFYSLICEFRFILTSYFITYSKLIIMSDKSVRSISTLNIPGVEKCFFLKEENAGPATCVGHLRTCTHVRIEHGILQ